MISAEGVARLLEARSTRPDVLSLHLKGPANRAAFEALLKEARLGDAPPEGKEDLERLRSFAASVPHGRGAAAFSSMRLGLWETTLLPAAPRPSLKTGFTPYLPPLLNALDQYRRYGVALLGADRARCCEIHLGEIVEHDFPAPSAPAGESFDLHRRLKAAAARLLDLARRRRFERVLLGVSRDLEPLALNHLHTVLQDELIVDTTLGPETPLPAVLDRVLTGEREARKVREMVLLTRLADADREGWVARGIEASLRALDAGKVRRLLVREDLSKLGRICPSCGRLELSGKRCPACGKGLETLCNIAEELAARALDAGCEVMLVADPRIDALGGVAAELSFH